MRLILTCSLTLALLTPAKGQLLPPNESGMTMGHVHLNVRNLDVQRKFWVEQFGATAVHRDGLSGVKLPGALILFREQEPTGARRL